MSEEGSFGSIESAADSLENEEGSFGSIESTAGPLENEQGSNSQSVNIPGWSSNAETYALFPEGHCNYTGEEQSLVWPPMLLMCSFANKPLDVDLVKMRNMLAREGVQASSVAETKYVCCEGKRSYHLFVLPPSGPSFVAAKAIDCAFGLYFHVFYPSLKDMIDVKNGRVPEFSRRIVEGLRYHGRPRQACNDLAVDLVRDDGICVGRGVCQKSDAMDCVDRELLGESHVGVLVLEVLDDFLPSHWKNSLRRWKTTHVLYNGVSLFECWRQYLPRKSKDTFYCEDGSDSAPIEQAEGVLRDQSISSVAPSFGIFKDLNVNLDYLSATCSKTCRDAIDAIEKSSFNSDSEAPRLYDGKSFGAKYKSDESLRKDGLETIINDASKERSLLERLGTTNSFHLTKDAVKRLTVLQKLNDPGCSSTAISSMVRRAERRELNTLDSIKENAKREKQNIMTINDFGSEIENFILRRREEQHKKLLKEVAKIKAKHGSTLEAFIQDKFKFVDDIGRRQKKTEGIHEWLSHYTAKVTDKEKKKWEEEVAEARLEEQKKWQEEVAKTRDEEKKKWEEQAAKTRIEEQKKWEEQLAEARLEQKKCEELSAKVMTELEVARQELADQTEAIPKCAICFGDLEGSMAKCGQKRSRNNVVLKQRGCFTPCMHSGMCLNCAVTTWEKFKRCPVCNIPCSSKPQPIFM